MAPDYYILCRCLHNCYPFADALLAEGKLDRHGGQVRLSPHPKLGAGRRVPSFMPTSSVDPPPTAAHLRERVGRCLRLADLTTDVRAARVLHELALEYEVEAAALEAVATPKEDGGPIS